MPDMTGMNLPYQQVREFHKAFNHPLADKPTSMDVKRALARTIWTAEELVEFMYASSNGDKRLFTDMVLGLLVGIDDTYQKLLNKNGEIEDVVVGQADALTDAMYFLLGSFNEIGVEPQPLFNIVQGANMAKLFPDGKPRYDADNGNKVIKPEGWVAPEPQLKAEINRQRNKG